MPQQYHEDFLQQSDLDNQDMDNVNILLWTLSWSKWLQNTGRCLVLRVILRCSVENDSNNLLIKV